jgi:hypothetical protein
MALSISAVIPTRGDVDLGRLAEHLRSYPEVKEITFTVGDAPYNRYRAARKALHDVIYVQDDDYLTDLRPIIDGYQPGVIVNAMTKQHEAGYQGEETLIGFGAIFDKALLSVLEGWEEDALFLGECDRVFTALTKHVSVYPTINPLPWATAPNRMCYQPDHGASHVAIRARIETFINA